MDTSPLVVASSHFSPKKSLPGENFFALAEEGYPIVENPIWTEEDHSQLLAELRNYAIKWKINR